MKNKKYIKKSFLALSLSLIFVIFGGANCSLQQQSTDIGIWKSTDRGDTWAQSGAIYGGGSLNSHNIRRIFFGPIFTEGELKRFDALLKLVPEPTPEEVAFLNNPTKTIYLSTYTDGLWTSTDDSVTWKSLNSNSDIFQIAPDPKNRNTLYFSQGVNIYKSLDQGRTWDKPHQAVGNIQSLAVDHYDTMIVYAGTDQGYVYKSEDAGVSWKVVDLEYGSIKKIYIDPIDSRRVYVLIEGIGIKISLDKGVTWKDAIIPDSNIPPTNEQADLSNKLKSISASAFTFNDKEKAITVMTVSGMLQTKDGGKTWKDLSLITPAQPVTRMVVDNQDHNKIYYVYDANQLLYKTDDDAKTWYNVPAPIGLYKYITDLAIDPLDGNILYITLLENKPKKSIIPQVQF